MEEEMLAGLVSGFLTDDGENISRPVPWPA